MPERDVNIAVKAKDEASKVLESVAAQVRRFKHGVAPGRDGMNLVNVNGAGGLLSALRVTGTLQAGIGGLHAMVEALRGDVEASTEAIFKLPLGLGQAARTMFELMKSASGLRDELESIGRESKRLDVLEGGIRGFTEIRKRFEKNAAEQVQRDRENLSLEALPAGSPQREFRTIDIAIARDRRKAQEDAAAAIAQIEGLAGTRIRELREQLHALPDYRGHLMLGPRTLGGVPPEERRRVEGERRRIEGSIADIERSAANDINLIREGLARILNTLSERVLQEMRNAVGEAKAKHARELSDKRHAEQKTAIAGGVDAIETAAEQRRIEADEAGAALARVTSDLAKLRENLEPSAQNPEAFEARFMKGHVFRERAARLGNGGEMRRLEDEVAKQRALFQEAVDTLNELLRAAEVIKSSPVLNAEVTATN